MGILPRDFRSNRIVPRAAVHHLPTGYRRPWAFTRDTQDLAKDDKNLHCGKDGFQVCVDVHHFLPSEVSVKTVDQTVIVEGKHDERNDSSGSIQRHFIRKYCLPKEYDINTVHSSLSSDGILTIKAPPPVAAISGERHVPITHTNIPVHLSVKDNKPHEDVKNCEP